MNKLKNIANSVNQFMNENFARGSNGRFIFFSVLSIMLVSTLLWGSTYSLFVSSNIDNDLNVYKTGNLNVTYTLSNDNVTLASNKTYSNEEAISIKPYRITVTNNGNVPYKFNVMLNNETASNAISSNYIMTQVGKLTPNRLSDCTDNIIKSDIIVLAGRSVDIDVRVWLADDTPNEEIGKSFFGSLTIDGIAVYSDKKEIDNSNLIANYRVNASEYIMSLYNEDEATEVNIAGNSSKPKVYLDNKNEDTWGIMLDNNGEYRYYGKNPNNYVEYNDELWRIISVSTVYSSEEDTEGSMRVRIIRDTSIGNGAWNNGNSNNWTDATLMCQLNTMYYNDTVPACTGKTLTSLNTSLSTDARNLIDNALWYLGGSGSSNLYADDYYNMERNNAGYGSNPTRWTGKVGIMYPSDYAYAADLSKCKNTGGSYSDSNCSTTNWLCNGAGQWLMSPGNSGSYTWMVYGTGQVNIGNVGYTLERRPLVVLKSDVMITGGSGTSGDAYKLASASKKLTEHIESLYDENNANSYYISGSETDSEGNPNQIVKLDSNSSIMKVDQGDTYGVEYRYYGASPNNYVDFNGELWRVISSSKVFSSESDTTGETRVRIIRANSIGSFSWDYGTDGSDYDNVWSNATLNTMLNGIYYNRTSGTCYSDWNEKICDYENGEVKGLSVEARNLTSDVVWYLGETSYYDLYADDWYNIERNNSGDESNPARYIDVVGIMYPSDYLYATDLSVCKKSGLNAGELVGYSDSNCSGTDWLFNSEAQWTIFSGSGLSFFGWYVNDLGDFGYDFYGVDYSLGVRPVVVLKSNVIITGGEGTSGDPYKLGLGM